MDPVRERSPGKTGVCCFRFARRGGWWQRRRVCVLNIDSINSLCASARSPSRPPLDRDLIARELLRRHALRIHAGRKPRESPRSRLCAARFPAQRPRAATSIAFSLLSQSAPLPPKKNLFFFARSLFSLTSFFFSPLPSNQNLLSTSSSPPRASPRSRPSPPPPPRPRLSPSTSLPRPSSSRPPPSRPRRASLPPRPRPP